VINYRYASNPKGPAGEPNMAATITIIAKATPTMMNRLFM